MTGVSVLGSPIPPVSCRRLIGDDLSQNPSGIDMN